MTEGLAAIIIEMKCELKDFPKIREQIESAVKTIKEDATVRIQYMEGPLQAPQVKT